MSYGPAMRRIAIVVVVATACSSKGGGATHRSSEPEAMFDAIRPALERAVAAKRAFPVASIDHLPAGACCDNPDHRCAPTELANQPWIDLTKLPSKFNFQLSYDSDGTTVTVHAIGDQDCDMTSTDTELSGRVDGNKVVWTVTKNAVDD